jgi:hypothetical protein
MRSTDSLKSIALAATPWLVGLLPMAVAQTPAPQTVKVLDEECVAARFNTCMQLVDFSLKYEQTPGFVLTGTDCQRPASAPHQRPNPFSPGCLYVGVAPSGGKCAEDTHALVTIPRTLTQMC